MRAEKSRTNLIIGILIIIIVILAMFLVYVFVVKPQITSYVIKGQNQGVEYVILSIMQQAETCQPVPLIAGNKTINMVAIGCLPQGCLQQPQQPPQ